MINLVNVTKYFRTGFFGIKKNAVNGLSLDVSEGSVTGFFGPNGAGKSTTIKMIVGLIHPSLGKVRVNGYEFNDYRARLNLGYLPENPSFPRGLKGIEIISYYGRLLKTKVGKNEIYEAMKTAGIFHAKDIHAHKYSKGMTQRLALAVSILGDPDVLILDEPLSGLDPIGRKEFKDIIYGLKERKKTIFFSSHILADSKELCDKIALLVKGKLLKNDFVVNIEKEAEEYIKGKPDRERSSLQSEYNTPLEEYLYDLMLNSKKEK